MTKQGFEKCMLFLQAWREAAQFGEQGMTAVAFALRNRQRAGWENGSWVQIIEHCNRMRYNEAPFNLGFPDLRDPTVSRFLARIDGIFDGSTPDTLTSCTHPTEGVRTGKYWCELDKITNSKFLDVIVRVPQGHPKTSQVAGLTFYA